MRVTMLVRSTAGITAKVKARTARQRQRVTQATTTGAAEVLETAQGLCPIDTGFMVEHLRAEISGQGEQFRVGFRASDFLGRTNPAGRLITAFYPVFIVLGTRFQAGNDFLTAALRVRRSRLRQLYREALTV